MGVIQNQLNRGIGIFDCDGYVTLSTAEPTYVGKGRNGEEVTSLHVDMAEITVSVDGTAGNAALFINCWNAIVQDGRWNNYAWTVKVDPDAVLLPPRLREHLAPHDLENVFILNCNAYPSSPNFPMMYGSLEVLSWKAIKSYKNNMWRCMHDMSELIPLWGEDRFMNKCLDQIGVSAIQDFDIIGDGVCRSIAEAHSLPLSTLSKQWTAGSNVGTQHSGERRNHGLFPRGMRRKNSEHLAQELISCPWCHCTASQPKCLARARHEFVKIQLPF